MKNSKRPGLDTLEELQPHRRERLNFSILKTAMFVTNSREEIISLQEIPP